MSHTRWSKFKKNIEAFWLDELDMVIHCTAYRHFGHSKYELPRYWIVLNGEMIWDFPGPFINGTNAGRLPDIPYWLHNQCFASYVMDEYVSLPRENLFDKIHNDDWELGDILRAADRRIGKNKLLEWGKSLHTDNPARKVLAARFPKREQREENVGAI